MDTATRLPPAGATQGVAVRPSPPLQGTEGWGPGQGALRSPGGQVGRARGAPRGRGTSSGAPLGQQL